MRRRVAEQWEADRAQGRPAPGTAPADARLTASEADEARACLEELCRAYVTAEESGAVALRATVAELPDVLVHLNGFPHHAARRLAETSDESWLLWGVAAVALENVSVDARDTLIGLGELWLAAELVGADPAAAFETLADRSEDDAARLLRGFSDSAHFAAEVEPRRVK